MFNLFNIYLPRCVSEQAAYELMHAPITYTVFSKK